MFKAQVITSFLAHFKYLCGAVLLPVRAVMMLAYNTNVDVKHLYSKFVGCEHSTVRLVGQSPLEGRIEFCNQGVWGRVCRNSFDVLDANVVCRQLGYSPLGN